MPEGTVNMNAVHMCYLKPWQTVVFLIMIVLNSFQFYVG